MISRRNLVGASVAVGGLGAMGLAARSAGVLDEVLHAAGVRPHTEPDPRDVELLAAAASDQRTLIAYVDAVDEQDDFDAKQARALLVEQLNAVSDPGPADASASPSLPEVDLDTLGDKIEQAADARASDALSAGSLSVMKVLAGMAAGLDQLAVLVRDVA